MVSIDSIERLIKSALAPTLRRAKLSVLRAVVDSVDDSTITQTIKADVLEDRTAEGEHFQPGGLSHVAAQGAEALAVAVGGDQGHTVMVCAGSTSRPKDLSEGETQLYSAHDANVYLNTDGEVVVENSTGSKITLKSDGNIDILSSGSFVNVGGSTAFIARADLVATVNGVITVWADAIVGLYNGHYHEDAEARPTLEAKTGSGTASNPFPPLAALVSVAATKGKVA